MTNVMDFRPKLHRKTKRSPFCHFLCKLACERMTAAGGVLKWCNNHQQLADGVTKMSARQKLAMELRRRMRCLRYDPEGTASKEVKQNVRQDEKDSLDQAAQEFQKQQMVKDGIYKIEEM